jgi:hypothetical protein
VFRREGLAHCHEHDFFGISSGTLGAGCDPLPYLGHILGDGHAKQ